MTPTFHRTARPTIDLTPLQPMARDDRRYPHSRVNPEAYRAWLSKEGRKS